MAFAPRFEMLLRNGAVANYAELGRLGHVSSARISQILNLRYLAPDLQEELLFLTRKCRGRDPIYLARLQPIAAQFDWAGNGGCGASFLQAAAGVPGRYASSLHRLRGDDEPFP